MPGVTSFGSSADHQSELPKTTGFAPRRSDHASRNPNAKAMSNDLLMEMRRTSPQVASLG